MIVLIAEVGCVCELEGSDGPWPLSASVLCSGVTWGFFAALTAGLRISDADIEHSLWPFVTPFWERGI